MSQVIIDTNCFLRLLLDDIPEQRKSVESLFQKAKRKEIVLIVPQIVIFEIHFVLSTYYHSLKEDVVEKLKTILSTEYLQIESRELFFAALAVYTANNSIGFVDSFLLAKKEQDNAELFTFDKDLKKLIITTFS